MISLNHARANGRSITPAIVQSRPLCFTASFLLLLLLAASPDPAAAQVELVDVFPHLTFDYPVSVTSDGTSNRLYVVEKTGRIKAAENDTSVTEATLFLDLTDRAVTERNTAEAGILGLAFHPKYEETGYFYVFYTPDNEPFRLALSRFERSSSNPDLADPDSEFILFELELQQSNCHHGGDLAFGPDGYLYISLGDDSCGKDANNNAQNLSTLPGSILRIDVDQPSGDLNYSIPPDNIFAGNEQGYREEIFAYGFRNPWRFSIDAETGNVWVGDVGEKAWEEVDLVTSGGNYGWPTLEGHECLDPGCTVDPEYVMPVRSYPHTDTSETTGRASISAVGGYVYRGTDIPSLSGKYIYADWGSGFVWALDYDGENPATNEVLLDAAVFPTAFGEDRDHELYVVELFRGKVKRLQSTESSDTTLPEPPGMLRLDVAGPNPFQQKTTLEFESDEAGPVRLAVYDVLGREVAVLFDGYLPAGTPQQAVLNAQGLAPGLLLCRLDAGGRMQIQRIIHVR